MSAELNSDAIVATMDEVIEERDQFEKDLGDAKDEIDYLTAKLGDANDKIEKLEEAFGRVWEEARKWA